MKKPKRTIVEKSHGTNPMKRMTVQKPYAPRPRKSGRVTVVDYEISVEIVTHYPEWITDINCMRDQIYAMLLGWA